MSWLHSADNAGFESVFSLRANLFEDYKYFYSLFWSRVLLPHHLMELTRLRVAQLHNCKSELSLRYRFEEAPTESKIEALPNWYKDSSYRKIDKACLEIAELFVQDPHSITDQMTESAKEDISDAGLVALMEWLALCDGFCRFQLMTEVSCDLPIRYEDCPRADTEIAEEK